jgi:hypothetical protein
LRQVIVRPQRAQGFDGRLRLLPLNSAGGPRLAAIEGFMANGRAAMEMKQEFTRHRHGDGQPLIPIDRAAAGG